MAFFTGWAEKLGDALVGLFPGAHAILLRKSDDSLDMLTSDGAGAAKVSLSATELSTLATAALEDAGNTSLATLCPCTLSPSADGTIAKSDDTVYDPPLRAIWATGAGNLVVMLSGDTASVMTIPVSAGEKITWASVRKVMAATTATGISGAR